MSRLLKCQVEPCGAAAVRALLCALMLVCPELLLGQASGGAPMIVNQPQNQFVLAGGTAAFSVTVNGQQPFFYQWFGPRGQAPDGKIADATNATLKISPVRTNDQGNYSVKVTNQFGMTQSGPATLTVMEVDFGDAPSPYPTLFADNGAQHQIVQGIQLGQSITYEPDGQPDAGANGDPGDDGVIFLTPLVPGKPASVRVLASVQGKLDAWIDFDANGDWAGAIDRIFQSAPLNPGANDLTFFVPAAAVPALTFARFRFSTDGGLDPTGWARNGEVEDYRVAITMGADLAVNANFSPNPVPPNSDGQCTISVVNFGPLTATNVVISNLLSGVNFLAVQSDADHCMMAPGVIACVVSNLARGEARSTTITFHPQQPALLTNMLVARSPVFDPDPSNNKSTMLIRAADPLVITQQPKSQRVLTGATVSFSVQAKGVGTLSYQWEINGAVAGETSSTLTLSGVQDSAQVRVQVSDAYGSVWSDWATLTVVKPPQITAQPMAMSINCGGSFQFNVQADGTPPFKFQWRLNGVNIRGANDSFYAVSQSTRTNGGNYSVVIANEAGFVVSDPVSLICADIQPLVGNDLFANRTPLPTTGTAGLSGVVRSENCNDTKESGEPDHAARPGSKSGWYQWTAPVTGVATFDTIGSTFDTLLAVYRGGDFSTLNVAARDDDSGGYHRSLVRFNVNAGDSFAIAIDGRGTNCGTFVLAWTVEQTQQFLPLITIHPQPQSGRRGDALSLMVDATPVPSTTQLYYQWFLNGLPIQGANQRTLDIPHLTNENVGTYTVHVFNGGANGRFIESDPTVVEIGPVPCIQSQDKPEDVLLNCGGQAPSGSGPPGLLMVGKQAASGLPPFLPVTLGIPGSQTMNNTNSTSDIDCFGVGNATRWLGITIDPNGSNSFLRIDTAGSAIATEIALYRFAGPSCLQSPACMHANLVACDTNSGCGGSCSQIQYPPLPGGNYLAFVDGQDGAQGVIDFNWTLGRPPVVSSGLSNCVVVVATNSNFTLSSGISGSPTPIYQWYYYGSILTNQTNSSISFTPIRGADAGCYSVLASNVFGIVTNQCCVIVDPPLLRYQPNWATNPPVCNLFSALLPGTILQAATTLDPIVSWANLVTNVTTNCYFQYTVPMFDTNGQPIPQCFYRTKKP